MKKIIMAGALAAIAMPVAACTSGNSGQVHSLQSKVTSLQSRLATDRREVAGLEHELTAARKGLAVAKRTVDHENAIRIDAVKVLEHKLKHEQSIISQSTASSARR